MDHANLVRWGGLAAVLAGILLLICDVLEYFIFGLQALSEVATTGVYPVIIGGFLLAALLFSLGLTGLYAGQAKVAGRIGFTGFLAAYTGTVLVAGAFWAQEFFVPAVAETTPAFLNSEQPGWLSFGLILSFSIFALGWFIFGVATLRARVYPRWAALLLMAGAVLFILPLPVPSALFDIAVVWLGFVLLTGRARQQNGEAIDPA